MMMHAWDPITLEGRGRRTAVASFLVGLSLDCQLTNNNPETYF